MDEIERSQIERGTYDSLPGMLWLEERLDEALRDCRTVSLCLSENAPTRMQSCILEVVPSGISTAQAIYQLLKLGLIPAANSLCRPLFEYTGISNLLLSDDRWVEFWIRGWPKSKDRPSLTQLISNISGDRQNEREAIHKLANEFHDAVHVTPKTIAMNMAPEPGGKLVHWLGPIPSAPERVENVAHATALCSVVLASNAKRAFFWDKG